MNEKHKLMKPKDPARSGRQASRRAKKWQRLSALLLTFLMFAGLFSSCVDEFPATGMIGSQTRAEGRVENTGGLIQDETTRYWMSQNCRVPIVGPGRVVTQLGNGNLVTVGSGSNKVGNVVDTDLDNYTTPAFKVLAAEVYTPIISIRDLHHVYAAGQKVGFVFKEEGVSTISLDVLNGMTIQTFLNGEEQESVVAYNNESGLLNLDVLSISSGSNISDRELSFSATKPFDEVCLSLYGVSADVLSNTTISVKYAFVGENPMIRATSELEFDYFWGDNKPEVNKYAGLTNGFFLDKDNVVDNDIENSSSLPNNVLTSLLTGGAYFTVNFNKEIPAGYEVGFCYSSGEALNIGLFSTGQPTLTAYKYVGGEWTGNPDGVDETGDKTAVEVTVLNVGIASGSTKAINNMRLTKPCDQLRLYWTPTVIGELLELGYVFVYYAYVREPVKLDPVNYFTIGDDKTYQSAYKLPIPSTDVTYSVVGVPDGVDITNVKVTENYVLQGMTEPGSYTIMAVYTAPNGEKMTQTATITKKEAKVEGGCNMYITEADHDAKLGTAIADWTGAILEIVDNTKNPECIFNSDHDDYATYTKVASLIGWDDVVSIDVKPFMAQTDIRVGFEVQAITGLLDLSALSRYRIALYNNGSLVKESNVSQGSVLDVGVLNFDNSRVRLSVEIPQGETFNHIELWCDNILIVADALKIYNVFYESTQCEDEGPNQACMEVMTDISYGLDIDYEKTVSGGVIGVAVAGIQNLDYLLDGDLETSVNVGAGLLDVGTGVTIGLKFNELPPRQPIGIVINQPTEILTADVLNGIQVLVYNDDNLVAKSDIDFSTVDVNLIAKNGKTYIEIPGDKITRSYNRIEITTAGIVGLIDQGLNIGGVYTRPDYDGDGIPDCSDDNVQTDIYDLTIDVDHICGTEEMPLFKIMRGGSEGLHYPLEFKDYGHSNGKSVIVDAVVKNVNGELILTLVDSEFSLTPGYYGISIKANPQSGDLDQIHDLESILTNSSQQHELTNICFLSVHPSETTWLGHNADWNDWDNWTNGVPWECTDVILPSPEYSASEIWGVEAGTISYYPNLVESNSRSNTIYDAPYYCQNIYFASGAELVGQHKLHYSGKVFIDKKPEVGSYQLVSVPLKETITGDMFIPANRETWEGWRNNAFDNFFKVIGDAADNTAYQEQRIQPLIYQRFWNQEVRNESFLSRSAGDYNTNDLRIVEIDQPDWSRSFNAIETHYTEGQGFAMRVGEDGASAPSDDNPYIFHFPKSYTVYHYYDKSGNQLHSSADSGNGINRNNDYIGKLWIDANTNANLWEGISLTRENNGTLFLFGNPVMSHIRLDALLAANPDVAGVKIFNGETYDSYTEEELQSKRIAPMEAVFLQTGSMLTELRIYLNEDMLVQGEGSRSTYTAPNQLRLTATSRGHSASCVVVPSSAASDDYDAREDATLLVGSEEGSGVAVYTVAGGKALSIQRMNQSGRIPVGFYLKEEGNVTLSFDPQGDAWQGWNLVDQQTGKRYPLDSETNLGTVKSGAGRFYLERTGN